jgi:hypothetical protein
MVIEPDPIEVELSQQVPKTLHSFLPIPWMSWTYTLPIVRRRADFAVDSHRSCVGVVFHIICDMQCIELSEDLGTLPFDPKNSVLRNAV